MKFDEFKFDKFKFDEMTLLLFLNAITFLKGIIGIGIENGIKIGIEIIIGIGRSITIQCLGGDYRFVCKMYFCF